MALLTKVFKCPFCEANCQFRPVKSNYSRGVYDNLWYAPWVCDNCHCIIVTIQESQSNWRDYKMMPNFKYKPMIRIDSLPDNIKRDYLEALNNYSEDSLISSVIMCRRIIQSTCYDKGAKKDTLYNQIEGLDIDKSLKELAHKIRFWGNSGAHPDILLGETVSNSEAVNAIIFTEKFLDFVYIIPKELEELEKNIEPKE